MIDWETAQEVMEEIPKLRALLAAERAKGGPSVSHLQHRLNALTEQLRAFSDTLRNPPPPPKVELVPKRSMKGHARFAADCDRGPNCSICWGLGGRDQYSHKPEWYE